MDALVEFFNYIEPIAFLVALVTTLLGALASGVSVSSLRLKKSSGSKVAFERTQLAEERLQETRDALKRQESIAQRNQWASSLLTFGQYIIGGILASSFVQESLSRPLVGSLGLLVLLSSLIHQRYRPDIKSRSSKERAVRLRSVIRDAENELAEIGPGSDVAYKKLELAKALSNKLAEIEMSEIRDLDLLEQGMPKLKGNGGA